MIGEFDIGGVLLSTALVSAVLALAATVATTRLMAVLRLYRFVWRPAVFDIALFVVLWAAAASFPFPFPFKP